MTDRTQSTSIWTFRALACSVSRGVLLSRIHSVGVLRHARICESGQSH